MLFQRQLLEISERAERLSVLCFCPETENPDIFTRRRVNHAGFCPATLHHRSATDAFSCAKHHGAITLLQWHQSCPYGKHFRFGNFFRLRRSMDLYQF